MGIKERIKNISEYFKKMQITTLDDGSQVIYIVVCFPSGWVVDKEIENKFGITIGTNNKNNEYYFCTDIDSGEEILFDAIDYNIKRMKEAIERSQLLSIKINELKSLFENESIKIAQLRTLHFSYNDENEIEKQIDKLNIKEKSNVEKNLDVVNTNIDLTNVEE